MNNILFNELKELNEKQIKDYFNSYFIETEYFHSNNNNLISLEEYLQSLKKMKEELSKDIKGPLSIVKQKYPLIEDIEPYFSLNPNIDLAIIEKEKIIIASKYLNNWEDFTKYTTSNETLDERNKNDIAIKSIQEELSQISSIVGNKNYSKEREGYITSSSNFIINPICFSLLEVLMQNKELLARIKLINNNYEVIDFNTNYLKRYTKDNVKRLYLSK